MRITQSRIEKWFEKGLPKNAAYMVLHRDEFSNEYWPTFPESKTELLDTLSSVKDEETHSIKEVYLEPQVKSTRAWNFN